MNDSHGWATDNDMLFICAGSEGLKGYNIANPLGSSNTLQHFPDIQVSDIILNNGLAIMIAEDGIYQYDYTNLGNINLVSTVCF